MHLEAPRSQKATPECATLKAKDKKTPHESGKAGNPTRWQHLYDGGLRASTRVHIERAQDLVEGWDIHCAVELGVYVLHVTLILANEDVWHMEGSVHGLVLRPLSHEPVRSSKQQLSALARVIGPAGLHGRPRKTSLSGASGSSSLQGFVGLFLVFETLIVPTSDESLLLLLQSLLLRFVDLIESALNPSRVGATARDIHRPIFAGARASPALIWARICVFVCHRAIHEQRLIVANRSREVEGHLGGNAPLIVDLFQFSTKLGAKRSVGTKGVVEDGQLSLAH